MKAKFLFLSISSAALYKVQNTKFPLILKQIVLIIYLNYNMTVKHSYQLPFDKINTLSCVIAFPKETITSPGMKSSVQEGLMKEYFDN